MILEVKKLDGYNYSFNDDCITITASLHDLLSTLFAIYNTEVLTLEIVDHIDSINIRLPYYILELINHYEVYNLYDCDKLELFHIDICTQYLEKFNINTTRTLYINIL